MCFRRFVLRQGYAWRRFEWLKWHSEKLISTVTSLPQLIATYQAPAFQPGSSQSLRALTRVEADAHIDTCLFRGWSSASDLTDVMRVFGDSEFYAGIHTEYNPGLCSLHISARSITLSIMFIVFLCTCVYVCVCVCFGGGGADFLPERDDLTFKTARLGVNLDFKSSSQAITLYNRGKQARFFVLQVSSCRTI